MDLSTGFPNTPEWNGSRDRRWIEIQVGQGIIEPGENVIQVHLTPDGRETSEPQGGKMITSVEVIQYGTVDRSVFFVMSDSKLTEGLTVLRTS
jgi:hypothetical protein